jgi:hypothetical protein
LGQLAPQGAGTATSSVVIGAYGSGALPKINANGAANAVLLQNFPYVTLQDLDLQAPGPTPNNTSPRRGVYVYGVNYGAILGVKLQRLVVHDVQGQLPVGSSPYNPRLGKDANASGGIIIEANGATTATWFDGVQVLDNEIRTVDRQGIYAWSNWCKRTALADFYSQPPPQLGRAAQRTGLPTGTLR